MTTNILQSIKEKKITDVRTNLQDASPTSAVYYYIRDGGEELFSERLGSANAGLVITNKKVSGTRNTIVVSDVEFYDSQKFVCDYLYGSEIKTKIIGVTGTNGKSTVVHLCSELLNYNKRKSFSVGTLGVMSGGKEIFENPGATSPSYIDTRRILHYLSDYEFMCLEVSSHSLHQNRLGELELEVAGWTNLTQDHLDYHGSMEEYLNAKLVIADKSKTMILSYQDKSLISELTNREVEFSVCSRVDQDFGPGFKLDYNRANVSLAYSLVKIVVGEDLTLPGSLSFPEGRFSGSEYEGSYFVVDYAHTPDALFNLVTETKKSFTDYDIRIVFGCGGDRDRAKRPLMLNAVKDADYIYITTDNPRTEDPEQIIDDIVEGSSLNFERIVKRENAISKAIRDSLGKIQKSVVLIAGKGHESYQEVHGEKLDYSDFKVIENVLKEIENES